MSPPRAAVIVPVESLSLCPGSLRWEEYFQGIRSPTVDLFGLFPVAGIVSEKDALRHPHHVADHGTCRDKQAIEEGALRCRAWLYDQGATYDRVVMLSGGPLACIWSRALAPTPMEPGTGLDPSILRRVTCIRVTNGIAARGGGQAVITGLPGFTPTIRARLVNALGQS